MSAKIRRFVPRLECFDDRCLPSATVQLAGTVLVIEGTSRADTVAIYDNGLADGVEVRDGTGAVLFPLTAADDTSPITNIVTNTYGGNDRVDYWLTGTLTVNRTVSVDLGRRNDTFVAHLVGDTPGTGATLGAGVELWIAAFGQGGADTLVLDAPGLNTDSGAKLFVNYQGGRGADTVDATGFTHGSLYLGQDFFDLAP